jgi:hypothetical protein
MPSLISKLQYKYSEKGEFAEEKSRSLDETLQLFSTIKWDEERGGEIGLTVPSVTIVDDMGNYLKVGTYFNGKFCLYYFDTGHRLYEHPVLNIEEAEPFIKDFFNGQLNVASFERHRGVINAASHFENGTFCYKVNAAKFYARMAFFTFLAFLEALCFCSLLVAQNMPLFAQLFFFPLISCIIGFLCYQQYKITLYYIRCRKWVLELSANSAIFSYGQEGEMFAYNKTDIANINMYGAVGKGQSPLSICVITFKNGAEIKIPVMLIDGWVLESKFPHIKVNWMTKKRDYKDVLDDFAKGK